MERQTTESTTGIEVLPTSIQNTIGKFDVSRLSITSNIKNNVMLISFTNPIIIFIHIFSNPFPYILLLHFEKFN